MASERLYRRSAAGKAAWERQDERVPLEYRRILGLIESEIYPDTLRARLPRYSLDEIVHLVDELLELGFLEVVEAGEHHDLDFTGEFSVPDLKKAAR